MGKEFKHWLPARTWRYLWSMAMLFAVFVTFEHFELPYGNIVSSISSAGKVSPPGNTSYLVDGMPSKAETVRPSNMTRFDSSNSTGIYGGQERGNGYGNETASVESRDLSDGIINVQSEESSFEKLVDINMTSTVESVDDWDNNTVPEEVQPRFSQENITLNSGKSGTLPTDIASTGPELPLFNLSPSTTLPHNVDAKNTVVTLPVHPNKSSVDEDATPSLHNDKKSGEVENNVTALDNDTSAPTASDVKKMPNAPTSEVVLISEMSDLLLQSLSSPHSMRPRWSSAVDQELLHAKSQIENAPIVTNDSILYAPLYRNVSMFKRSYELMEELLKVYVYREGERPILHQPFLNGIYASEGWFMKLMEANKNFVTKDPKKAHLFYLPFSSRNLEETLYVANSHSHKNLIEYLKNYLGLIAAKHPFWNRTDGADHFLVACHDWAPAETKHIMSNCIRALCNADVKEGFIFGKDASLPETYIRFPQKPLRDLGGQRASRRSILAFFAGNMHGSVRPTLLQHWENKDPDMKIFGVMPKVKGNKNYIRHMKSSKYCICAKGYEVNSPRVVEAIFYECVPVIISDNFVPPFFEVLDWESFAVFVLEKDIPNLKNILLSIPEKRYRQMQMRVKRVQKHFLWHPRPEKYDLFHMILHSVWYNRVFRARAR